MGTLFNEGLLIKPATKLSQLSIDTDKSWPFIVGANPVTPLTNAPAYDTYTKLLMHMDGADSGVIFTDEIGHIVTPYGNAQTKTAIKEFGTASGHFDGINSYLSIAANATDWDFAGNDFTIDFWFYPTAAAKQAIFCGDTDQWLGINFHMNGVRNVCIWASSTGVGWNLLNADPGGNGIGTVSISLNNWHHIALVRSGNHWMTFLDGIKDLDVVVAGNIINRPLEAKSIGRWGASGDRMWNSGYADEFRISKGIARWTINFSPPVTAYAPANPSLTTDSLVDISATEATFNGTVTAINDGSITERGFVWDTVSRADPGNVDPSLSGYANYHKDTGAFGIGAFDYTATGLVAYTTYYIRAFAKNNTYGYSYGGEQAQIIGLAYGITELKELAAGMQCGDMLYYDGARLNIVSPSYIGTQLMTHDMGNPPTFEYPP